MRLVEIRRYPVKSLRGHSLDQAFVERIGFLTGDRRWVVVDEAGKFLTQRQAPRMAQIAALPTPNGVELRHAAHGALAVDIPGEDIPVETIVVWRATRYRAHRRFGGSLSLGDSRTAGPARLSSADGRRAHRRSGLWPRRRSRQLRRQLPLLITSTAIARRSQQPARQAHSDGPLPDKLRRRGRPGTGRRTIGGASASVR